VLPGFSTIPGVFGTSNGNTGVVGTSNQLMGVYGFSTGNAGVGRAAIRIRSAGSSSATS
jgi:hypothetical protein